MNYNVSIGVLTLVIISRILMTDAQLPQRPQSSLELNRLQHPRLLFPTFLRLLLKFLSGLLSHGDPLQREFSRNRLDGVIAGLHERVTGADVRRIGALDTIDTSLVSGKSV